MVCQIWRPRRVGARAHARRRTIVRRERAGRQRAFDFVDNAFRFRAASVDQKPARAFRDPAAKEDDDEAEGCADGEGEAPAEPERQITRIEQDNRRGGAHRGADPIGTVDEESDAAAETRRNQLVDGGIDRGVFAADAGAGQGTEKSVTREAPGKCGQRRCYKINGHGDEE